MLVGCAALGLPIVGATIADPLASDPSFDPSASLDPAATPAPTPAFFTSHDGYALTLPAGWVGATVTPATTQAVLDLLGTTDATLATLAQDALVTSGAAISMIGGQVSAETTSEIPAGVAVLVLRTSGVPDEETEAFLAQLIADVPGAADTLAHKVVTLAAGDAHRFDLTVEGDQVGSLRLRIYLFSAGDDAIIVTFAAPVDAFDAALPAFDSIIKSLRFGV
jgi:hypothetical protein